MLALLAGVEIESALGALANGIGEILQERSALGATGNGASAGHVEGPRSESVFFFGSFVGGRVVELFFCAATGILIPALAILAVGQKSASL